MAHAMSSKPLSIASSLVLDWLTLESLWTFLTKDIQSLPWLFALLESGISCTTSSLDTISQTIPPWLAILAVLASISYAGNLDRRWWFYILTVVFLSPAAYRAFWPFRNFVQDDEVVRDLALNGVSLLCAAVLIFLGGLIYRGAVCAWVPKAEILVFIPPPQIPIPFSCEPDGSGEQEKEAETAESVPQFERRPSRPRGRKPPRLNVTRFSSAANENDRYSAISAAKKRMNTEPWRKMRSRQPSTTSLATPGVTVHKSPKSVPESPGRVPPAGQEAEDPKPAADGPPISNDGVPEKLPTPDLLGPFLSRPERPSPLTLEIQVLKTWEPISSWLLDPTVDSTEKWSKVLQTIDGWAKTCENLRMKRIARYSIGVSSETAEIVLGPMSMSMRDMLDFFHYVANDQSQCRNTFRRFGPHGLEKVYDELGVVKSELQLMSSDYISNETITTIAGLARKVDTASRTLKRKLQFVARQNAEELAHQAANERFFREICKDSIPITLREACAIIEDWHHICTLWEQMDANRFYAMVEEQCRRANSSLARMGTQMLALLKFSLREDRGRVGGQLPEERQEQLRSVVSVLDARMEPLGQLPATAQCGELVVGVRQCARNLRSRREPDSALMLGRRVSNGLPALVEVEDELAEARHEFLTKILTLGREARGYGIAADVSVEEDEFQYNDRPMTGDDGQAGDDPVPEDGSSSHASSIRTPEHELTSESATLPKPEKQERAKEAELIEQAGDVPTDVPAETPEDDSDEEL